MKTRDIVIGLVVLLLLAGVIYWRQRVQTPQEIKTPETLSTQNKIEDKFNVQIPEGVEKAELKDVSGGNASGIATRKFENGEFELGILADLPTTEAGSFYEGWISKGEEGEEGYEILSLGGLTVAKGGYLLDFKSPTNYSDYGNVVVSLEKSVGEAPDQRVLEGSF
jgi:hypothetical protein